MFVVLFLGTFVLALALAATIAWASKELIVGILRHFFASHISVAFGKYLQLAIILVGVTAGTRVHALQEYISAPEINKPGMLAQLTQEFWVMELYRTVVGTLEAILWLLLLFALVIVLAVIFNRKTQPATVQSIDSKTPVARGRNARL